MDKLLQELRLIGFDKSSVILTGSGAAKFHIPNSRDPKDFDVIVDQKTLSDLKQGKYGVWQEKETGGFVQGNITVWPELKAGDSKVTFNELKRYSKQTSDFLIPDLEWLIEWKIKKGKDKDLKDAELMKEYLSNKSSERGLKMAQEQKIEMLRKCASDLDSIADKIESKGLIKEAFELDKISDELEAASQYPWLNPGTPEYEKHQKNLDDLKSRIPKSDKPTQAPLPAQNPPKEIPKTPAVAQAPVDSDRVFKELEKLDKEDLKTIYNNIDHARDYYSEGTDEHIVEGQFILARLYDTMEHDMKVSKEFLKLMEHLIYKVPSNQYGLGTKMSTIDHYKKQLQNIIKNKH